MSEAITQERAQEICAKIYRHNSGGGNISRHLTSSEHNYVMKEMRATRKRYSQVIYEIAYPRQDKHQ